MAPHFTTFVAVFFLLARCFVNGSSRDEMRFDCYPERVSLGEKAINKTLCEARGCVWKEPVKNQVRHIFSHNLGPILSNRQDL